jgi:hypothetical protein
MTNATKNLLKDAEVLIEQFDTIGRMDEIGDAMTVELAEGFGYDAENFEGIENDGEMIHLNMWDNAASALHENKAGDYSDLQLVHVGSVEGVLKAVDPEAYEACQAVEDFFWVMAN